MTAWARPILIAGVGSEYGSDDSAGLIAARNLRIALEAAGALRGEVRVVEETGHLTSLMEHWNGIATAVIIDAAVTGRAPGGVIRCEDDSLPMEKACRFASTHGFGILEAIEMARHLGVLPNRVVIYGIEAAHFGAGDTMCAEVSRAIDEVVAKVVAEVNLALPSDSTVTRSVAEGHLNRPQGAGSGR
jgi:hydrogenase maturation protease